MFSMSQYTNRSVQDDINSLAPGRYASNFKSITFKLITQNSSLGTCCESLVWIPENLTYEKSTLAQVMAWCHQVTSCYFSQCWSRSVSPFGVTKPNCVHLILQQNSVPHFTISLLHMNTKWALQNIIQWKLHKTTTKFCDLSKQVVFHGREKKHDFVKTVPGKWWNLCVFSKTFPVSLYKFHCSKSSQYSRVPL